MGFESYVGLFASLFLSKGGVYFKNFQKQVEIGENADEPCAGGTRNNFWVGLYRNKSYRVINLFKSHETNFIATLKVLLFFHE